MKSDNKGVNFTYVDLVERASQCVIRVASQHASGFDLDEPVEGLTVQGDKEISALLRNVESPREKPPEVTIIGVDANTTPDIHPARLELYKNQGYKWDPADRKATNFNPFINNKRGATFSSTTSTASREEVIEWKSRIDKSKSWKIRRKQRMKGNLLSSSLRSSNPNWCNGLNFRVEFSMKKHRRARILHTRVA